MTQAKLYPSGELKDHPPLRTLDEAMRERVVTLLERFRDVLTAVPAHYRDPDEIARLDAVLALLKE